MSPSAIEKGGACLIRHYINGVHTEGGIVPFTFDGGQGTSQERLPVGTGLKRGCHTFQKWTEEVGTVVLQKIMERRVKLVKVPRNKA